MTDIKKYSSYLSINEIKELRKLEKPLYYQELRAIREERIKENYNLNFLYKCKESKK